MSDSTAVAPAGSSSTALVIPDDIRRDLLKAQQESLGDALDLPQIKIAAAGLGAYEFPDGSDPRREFKAIILGAHKKNVLWTEKMSTEKRAPDDPNGRPACSSIDGKHGTPREGFTHLMLNGKPATGTELLECEKCPYNQFGTGNLFIADKKPGGKAVTNKMVLYLMLPRAEVPYVLELNTMSMPNYADYVKKLTREGLIVQQVVTTFRQVVNQSGSTKVANAIFDMHSQVDQRVFDMALAMRGNWAGKILPSQERLVAAMAAVEAEAASAAVVEGGAPDHASDGQPVGNEPSLLDEHIDVATIPADDADGDQPPF